MSGKGNMRFLTSIQFILELFGLAVHVIFMSLCLEFIVIVILASKIPCLAVIKDPLPLIE